MVSLSVKEVESADIQSFAGFEGLNLRSILGVLLVVKISGLKGQIHYSEMRIFKTLKARVEEDVRMRLYFRE